MNKSVFLDRDGVINEVQTDRVKFVNRPEDVHLLPGVPEAIAKLRQLGFKIFVVTNQGGVGLGYMTEKTLHKIHEKMQQDLIAADPVMWPDIFLHFFLKRIAICSTNIYNRIRRCTNEGTKTRSNHIQNSTSIEK